MKGDAMDPREAEMNAALLTRRAKMMAEGLVVPAVAPVAPKGSALVAPPPPALRGLVERVAADMAAVPTVSPAFSLVAAAMDAIGRSVVQMRERCHDRGIHRDGENCEAMLAWDPGDGWEELSDGLRRGVKLFLITGNKGTGKSCFAAHVLVTHRVMNSAHEREVQPYFFNAGRLAEALSRPYDDEKRAIKRRAEGARVVAIDDFGRLAMEEREFHAFTDYLCGRLSVGVRVVITSNLAAMELWKILQRDGRLRDRAVKSMVSIHLSGQSRRRPAPSVSA